MVRAEDNSRDRRRRRTPSVSPDAAKERRRKDRDEEYSSTRRRDDGRSSKDDRRRRDSHSPDSKSSYRRDDRRRERRDRSRDSVDARRSRRGVSREDSHRRRHRDRGHDERDRPSKRPRSRLRSHSPAPRLRRSRSPPTHSRSASPRALKRSKGPLPSQKDAFSSNEVAKTDSPAPEKQKPNFGNTGRLAAESNTVTVNGTSVVLKYHEPPEARKPPAKDAWRLYVFKGSDLLETVELGERSCWLVGRERLVVDFPVDHPSCSKQHAAIQFRYVEKRNEFGDRIGRVRPYLIDLESANGSMVNDEPIPAGRYVELRDKDVLKFGLSSREYVLMLPPPE
ncbi:conserved hypothetical protein [Paecilomyces variotii No. 5]|uniref:FHA domain-containing protein n=1 Tax=Byssochlamys spectabilis (strain No. 5 / NBRC 109023) TaxID=1356009 RepID=V5FT65_BYSSN|nr:conserved hypothetical protein [Paecilomyces variotii No. 5]